MIFTNLIIFKTHHFIHTNIKIRYILKSHNEESCIPVSSICGSCLGRLSGVRWCTSGFRLCTSGAGCSGDEECSGVNTNNKEGVPVGADLDTFEEGGNKGARSPTFFGAGILVQAIFGAIKKF
jgi:hypothetical protein